MKEYIEKSLRRSVTIEHNTKLYEKLPLKYKGLYELFSVFQDEVEWIIAKPKVDIRLSSLRHDRKQIEKATGLNCALYFTKVNFYSKETMLDEGIPFIIEGKQVFLPFIGMLLSENANRNLKPVHLISFLTQKLILCAIYEKWTGMNVTKIAERLGVSKMSVTRCFDEIEYLGLDILDTSGKNRKITVAEDQKRVWEEVQPILRNPVITRFQLAEDISLNKKAGMTALCEYSMLSDNSYPTYAITKREVGETNIRAYKLVEPGEEIGCEVLELGYFIDSVKENVQDPLSVILSLTKEEMEDERVQMCIDEMLEGNVW